MNKDPVLLNCRASAPDLQVQEQYRAPLADSRRISAALGDLRLDVSGAGHEDVTPV